MWYGYRLNDQKDWVKMKNFETLAEYRNYIEMHRITYSYVSTKEINLLGKALITHENNVDRSNPYAQFRKSK